MGITAKELSRISGVSDATVYRMEGRVKSSAGLSEKLVKKIAEATGVDFEWLFDTSIANCANCDDIVWKAGDMQIRNSQGIRDDKNAECFNAPIEGKSERVSSDDLNQKPGYEPNSPIDICGETCGERIRDFRMERSLTQEQFAKTLDITQSYLATIESGKVKLTEQVAYKIEKVYEDVGAEWFLTGDERNRVCPVTERMIEWLKNHQRARETIKLWMDDKSEEMDDA